MTSFETIEVVHTVFSSLQQQQYHVDVYPVENSCAAISVGVQADVQADFEVNSVGVQASTEPNNVGVQAESEADDVGTQTPMANRFPPILGLQSAPVSSNSQPSSNTCPFP